MNVPVLHDHALVAQHRLDLYFKFINYMKISQEQIQSKNRLALVCSQFSSHVDTFVKDLHYAFFSTTSMSGY